MAYRFNLKTPIERDARRIALEQIDRAAARQVEARDVWVHETRKGLKRVRALLRLVRSGADGEAWQQINVRLREIGRTLSPGRDRAVRRQTMAAMAEGAPARLQKALSKLAAADAERAGASGAAPQPAEESAAAIVADTLEALGSVRDDLQKLRIEDGLGAIADGLATAHRRARRSLDDVAAEPTDEGFHELRKAVQVHWRQMRLLTAVWPKVIDARARAAQDLAQVLGEDHDLAVLGAFAREARDVLTPAEQGLIADACRKRHDELRAGALEEARRLFVLKPRAFGAEVAEYWRIAEAARGARRREREKRAEKAKG